MDLGEGKRCRVGGTLCPEIKASRRRAATASQQRKAAAAWRDDGSLDAVDFRRDTLQKLQDSPARAIAESMGATISHGSKMRGGTVVPHRRHWKALRGLLNACFHLTS